MASATLIKRFAKRDRRIGSGVEEAILCLRGDQEQGDMLASTLTWSIIAARDALRGAPSDQANR